MCVRAMPARQSALGPDFRYSNKHTRKTSTVSSFRFQCRTQPTTPPAPPRARARARQTARAAANVAPTSPSPAGTRPPTTTTRCAPTHMMHAQAPCCTKCTCCTHSALKGIGVVCLEAGLQCTRAEKDTPERRSPRRSPSRNRKEPRGTERNREEPRGTERNRRGSARSARGAIRTRIRLSFSGGKPLNHPCMYHSREPRPLLHRRKMG
jgi:hypothetical protein